jgi:hypothetical protein
MKTTLSIAALAVLAVGCSTTPKWDSTFGEASRDLRTSQTYDGQATARNANTLAPTDGKAAAGAQTKYSTSMGYAVKEAAPPVVIQSTAR